MRINPTYTLKYYENGRMVQQESTNVWMMNENDTQCISLNYDFYRKLVYSQEDEHRKKSLSLFFDIGGFKELKEPIEKFLNSETNSNCIKQIECKKAEFEDSKEEKATVFIEVSEANVSFKVLGDETINYKVNIPCATKIEGNERNNLKNLEDLDKDLSNLINEEKEENKNERKIINKSDAYFFDGNYVEGDYNEINISDSFNELRNQAKKRNQDKILEKLDSLEDELKASEPDEDKVKDTISAINKTAQWAAPTLVQILLEYY